MVDKRIELGHILQACLIILGFSLALITYFKGEISSRPYTNIIFWLIIMPFGIEALIVCASNATGKYRKAVDSTLAICFLSLLASLLILFSYNLFPDLTFIKNYSEGVGVGALLVISVFVLGLIQVLGTKAQAELKSKIFKSFYRLEKKLNKGESIGYIVGVLDDWYLQAMVVEMVHNQFLGYGFRGFTSSKVLNREIDLSEEDIAVITDSSDKLLEIIKGLEDSKNRINGIITTFNLRQSQKTQLEAYKVEECLLER